MAKSPDRLEREAQVRNPARYNPRNPWPKVDAYVESTKNAPRLVLPTEEETMFADLPIEEYGNVKANLDRWAAAEELAASLGKQRQHQYQPGVYYPGYDPMQDEIAVNVARDKLRKANERVATFSERLQNPKPLKDYPTLAKALIDAPDVTEADVRRIVNFAAAWTAADAIWDAPDEYSKWNIFLSLPDIQRLVVWDIWQSKVDDEQKRARDDQLEEIRRREGAIEPTSQISQDVGAAALSAIGTFYEGIQQYARGVVKSVGESRQEGKSISATAMSALVDPFFIWDEVGPSTWTEQTLEDARKEFGPEVVDVVVEIQNLYDEGDPSPLSTVQAKYYGDPEKARVLRLLSERQFDDPELVAEQQNVLSAADKILSAQANDLGKMVTTTNPITGQPVEIDSWWRGSTPQQILSVTTNVASTFLLDPLIVGNKVRTVYLGAKYGLERIAIDAGEKSVTAALNKAPVRAYLDDLTGDLKKYKQLADEGKDNSQLGQTIARRYQNYFPEDVLFDMARQGIDSPEAFIKYVNDTNAVLAIERGKIISSEMTPDAQAAALARVEEKSVFARLANQQMAQRGKPLLPRNSILWASHIRRKVSDALSVGARSKSAREEVRAFYKDANNPDVPAGAILFDNPAAVSKFDEKITNSWDRTTRWAAQTTGRDVIYTADARDTQVFYRFARIFMSRNHAQFLSNEWRNASQSQRILMWVGLVRSAAERRGASEIAEQERHIGSAFGAFNPTQKTVGEIADELTFARDPRNLFSPESAVIDDAGTTVDDWIDSQVDEFIRAREEAGEVAGKSAQQLDSEVDGFRAGLLALNPDTVDVLSRAVRTSPSNFDGQQLPLHLWQTSDYLSVPNMSDLELITKRNKLTNALIGATPDTFANNFVNWWSMVNLAGFRYSVRNATEDYTMYALTGGYLKDVFAGRAMSTALREVRGDQVYSKTFGFQPNIGFFARKMRKARGEAGPDYNPYSIWDNLILPQLNKEEISIAKEAMETGDLSKFRELLTVAVVRQKLGRVLNEDEVRYINEYVLSDESFIALDDLVELAQGLNLGTMPGSKFSGGGTASPGSKMFWPRSSFVNLEMRGGEPFKYSWWHRGLEGVMLRDGSIGKIAVANLDNPDEAINAVAEAIKSDTKYGYRERLAAFFEVNVSDEEFARRYVQDVLNMFSRRDGSFNQELWSNFIRRGPNGERIVSWNMKVDDKFVPVVSLEDLSKIDPKNAPKYVLGKSGGSEGIEIPISISEKIWNSMGNAFARIAKEPIYFANYVRSRKGLAQYESSLAKAVGPQAASIAATKIAQDRALALTLAFTDNPKNRSMLAYRLRNYARYYRAQEDFYRRVYRAAKYNPIAFYKAYLAIGVLDETGFIYEDSYGEKYFLYPGDGLVNNVLARAMAYGGGDKEGLYFSSSPLIFGGKITQFAPSFDINAAVPSLSSPLSTFAVKTVLNLVPDFQKYEDNLLGTYAEGKPTAQAMMPGPFLRAFALFDRDERYSMYASAWMGAAKVLQAAGKLPGEGALPSEVGESWNGIASLANQILLLRFALGFVYPAIPQIMENNVTTYARKYGYDGMTTVYRKLVDQAVKDGEPDPYASALLKGVSIYGTGFVAYSHGKTKQGLDLKSLPEYSYDSKVLEFTENNKALLDKYPAAGMFLAPTRGPEDEYDPATRRFLMDNGYRVPLAITEFKKELRLGEAQYVYQVTMDDADEAIANANTPQELERAEKDKKAAKAFVYSMFDDVDLSKEFMISSAEKQSNADKILNGQRDENGVVTGRSEMRMMIQDFYDGKYGNKIPKSVEKIAEAIATYDAFTTASKEIAGRKRAEVDARAENRTRLLANLRAIAEEDPNAEMFIRRVMYPLLKARPDGTPR